MIRLVATDVDGTLLHSDGTVSERTRRALRAAADAGLLVVFVTGRPPRWLDALVEQTDHVGVAVGGNGAFLYDLAEERLLTTHTLHPSVVLQIALELRASFPGVGFAVEYVDGFAAESGYHHDWDVNPALDRRGQPLPPPPEGPIETLAVKPVLKLLAKDSDAVPDEFLAAAIDLVGERANITHSSSFGLLEISAPHVTKATGLEEVATSHGISAAEVVAVGDMPNDVSMLRWAGRSYAVANAHPAAKQAADQVIATNDEDAVAALIESLLEGSLD